MQKLLVFLVLSLVLHNSIIFLLERAYTLIQLTEEKKFKAYTIKQINLIGKVTMHGLKRCQFMPIQQYEQGNKDFKAGLHQEYCVLEVW